MESEFVQEFLNETQIKGEGELRVFQFEETLLMSPYLVAMTVTTFDHVQVTRDDGLLIR